MSAKNNPIYIATPLKDDSLVISHATFKERLGEPFLLEACMLSVDERIDFKKLLGKNLTLRYESHEGTRYINGIVAEFRQLENIKTLGQYVAIIRPWIWLLSLSKHCRIFQQKSYPDIIKAVFDEMGFSDYKLKLSSRYQAQEYVVQYNESDLNFVSRIMQQEGMYYCFEHSNGKHTLVLYDDVSNAPSLGKIEYHDLDDDANLFEVEGLFSWESTQQLKTTCISLSSYDFTLPHKNLNTLAKDASSETFKQLKYSEYRETFNDRKVGDRYAQLLMEQQNAEFDLKRFEGNMRHLEAGSVFKLIEHPRDDQNKDYLVTELSFKVNANAIADGPAADQQIYECEGRAISSKLRFRQQQQFDIPRVSGLQSATVIGKEKDQVFTDKYGRIKVRFHWDNAAVKDEHRSCWIRVAQSMSGKGWGSVSIPRAGQEVLVDFLQGDINQPIVVGSLYNGANPPPYEMPKLGHLSGFRSKSAKQNGKVNEIRFDDTDKQEQLYVSAAYNCDILIANDCFETVGADKHTTIKKDKLEKIGNDHSIDITANQTLKVGKDSSVNITGKYITQVGDSYSLSVKGNGGAQYDKNLSIGVNEDAYLKGSNVCIEATNNLTLKVGSSYIAIERGGISINSPGKIMIESSQNLQLESGAKAELNAKSAVTIKGKSVNIN